MSGVSVSTLVLFIASVLVAAGVAGTLVATVGDISASAENRGEEVTASIDADVALLNDGGGSDFYAENETAGNATVTFYVRNTGSTTLAKEPKALDVLVDGRYVGDVTVTTMNGDASRRAWVEGEVVEVVAALDWTLDGAGHRLTISVGGAERSVSFSTERA
jgi:flagellar protein FlaG